MIPYSNILPPIQCVFLIKRSIATLYGVLCLIEESFILSIKELSTYFFINLLHINRVENSRNSEVLLDSNLNVII